MNLEEVYRSVLNRASWEQVQREKGDQTDDAAWASYLRFVRKIFGVNPESVQSSKESSTF